MPYRSPYRGQVESHTGSEFPQCVQEMSRRAQFDNALIDDTNSSWNPDLMSKSNLFLGIAVATVVFSSAFYPSRALTAAARTQIHVSTKARNKLKDLSMSLRMVELTPVVNDANEVLCLEISKIHDKLVSDQLKAQVGDCFSEVVAYKKEATGKVVSEKLPLLSPKDAMMLYQQLLGAHRIDIDLKRKKKTVSMTYLID